MRTSKVTMTQAPDYNFLDQAAAILDQTRGDEAKMALTCETLVPEIERVVLEAKKSRKNTSADFNQFSVFTHKEPMHSRILAALLNPNGDHGQGALFLHSFLKLLEINDHDKGTWVVNCETGRIDICLERDDPKSVIIIENKSNYAIDQKNQLYRYWYEKIHPLHNKRPEVVECGWSDFYKIPGISSAYKIIYLTPSEEKIPDEISLKRPKGISSKKAPDELPLKYEILTFRTLLIHWRGDILNKIPKSNHRLREYLSQYVEFWTET